MSAGELPWTSRMSVLGVLAPSSSELHYYHHKYCCCCCFYFCFNDSERFFHPCFSLYNLYPVNRLWSLRDNRAFLTFNEVEIFKKADCFLFFLPQTHKQVGEKNDSVIMTRETDRLAADRQTGSRLCASVRQQESIALGSDTLLRPTCHSEAFQHTGSDSSDKPVLLSITATRRLENTHPAEGGVCVHANWGQREAQEGRQGQGDCHWSCSSLIPVCFLSNLKGRHSLNVLRAAFCNRPDRDAPSSSAPGGGRSRLVSGAAAKNVDMTNEVLNWTSSTSLTRTYIFALLQNVAFEWMF